jgi:hypothetical protein
MVTFCALCVAEHMRRVDDHNGRFAPTRSNEFGRFDVLRDIFFKPSIFWTNRLIAPFNPSTEIRASKIKKQIQGRLRKFLEENGAGIGIPDDRNFETEGEAIESGLRRTIAGRDMVMRSLIRVVYRFRDATLVAEKKDDFGSALQNLYRELERAENLVGPAG